MLERLNDEAKELGLRLQKLRTPFKDGWKVVRYLVEDDLGTMYCSSILEVRKILRRRRRRSKLRGTATWPAYGSACEYGLRTGWLTWGWWTRLRRSLRQRHAMIAAQGGVIEAARGWRLDGGGVCFRSAPFLMVAKTWYSGAISCVS